MSIDTIQHQGKEYPRLQSEGFAAQFAWPFAKKMCQGHGLDIGCNRPEWAFPGAVMIDPNIDPKTTAYDLPTEFYDYIFSSHCLEHLPDWVGALDHWGTRLKEGGVIFLYLPHYDQTYWRPWNNRKHINIGHFWVSNQRIGLVFFECFNFLFNFLRLLKLRGCR